MLHLFPIFYPVHHCEVNAAKPQRGVTGKPRVATLGTDSKEKSALKVRNTSPLFLSVLRPFRTDRFCLSWSQGLVPWAVAFHPFGVGFGGGEIT